VVDPLFNKFGPMHDRALEARILAEADRAGIEGSRVFEVNKSADTKTLNAYVTGFGGSKRIVLWDTIIREMNERELLFVVMKKDDCVYDFALIAPPGSPFERSVGEFEAFVAGFSTEVQ
jgi:hypothetical protein